ncbi:lactonase family protein [Kitasatospora sp. NBC_01287]|uniref:lactonase family protein n=1 Tax=Kitasatospora sp. NBC_01287 TaxID=2903573 RepID=UPI00225A5B37|nr:beta-propeller fold lactonase family protein [Kitasatospora sp. NBC_01287]MCX4744264.1 lactonase family protein [Kitasatospora sp. NBC_01287]
MHRITRLAAATATVLAAVAVCAPSTSAAASTSAASPADAGHPTGGHHAVFVQTDNPAGNQVIAYHRGDDGLLTRAGDYDTGGLGGVLDGSVVDHLASQGSLTYDARHGLLYAVNAGSDSVTVFAVDGDRLERRQTVGSGGRFPVSVAVHDDVVYVLNALDGGSVQGFRVREGRLERQDGWNRCLGLDPDAVPQFTNTPGQVGFTADGSRLVVTTKANGNSLAVFRLDREGAPAQAPVVTVLPGAVPFAFVPNGRDGLFVTQAGPNALSTIAIRPDGSAEQQAFAATGQAATCWVVAVDGLLYTSNAGSATVSGFRPGDGGRQLTALGNTPTDPGTVDAAASVTEAGRYLYVQTGGNGIVDEFAVGREGSLTAIGSVTVPDAVGGEGIVAL